MDSTKVLWSLECRLEAGNIASFAELPQGNPELHHALGAHLNVEHFYKD